MNTPNPVAVLVLVLVCVVVAAVVVGSVINEPLGLCLAPAEG